MNDAPAAASSSLESLVAAVADEFRERRQRGENPKIEEYAARHPEAADLLRRVLGAMQLLELSAASGTLVTADGTTPEALGDFRLIREVGRGGMGVVYEAEQLSLGRRVALKVLPFAATMDPKHLQRFHNEARAAASLHHEHIVPVYFVGNERGVHFYAMQFIDGRPLTELVRERRGDVFPTPTPTDPIDPDVPDTVPLAQTTTPLTGGDAAWHRRVAELGAQAADALEYAHSVGIVHRDVKPGNLLVDGHGRLWVTDFGLAKHGDVSLTMSGDLLGTLRYMSPEQALARHGLVDHRTDIHSLGATLYELLTGRPAIVGEDRQEILKQIAFEEPPAPRKLDPKLPRDLETVVQKCLEKNPDYRYATAKDLADDLRHWLANEPIRAKPATLVQRARKWSRRHPTIVPSAVLILALLTAGSLLSTWLIWREKGRTADALAAETAQRNRADEEKRIARERDEETADVLRFIEESIFAAARPEGQKGGLGHEVKLRRALEAALPLVARSFHDKPLTEARLRRTLGLSFHYLGEWKTAVEQFEAARALYTKHRGAEHPDTLTVMNNLATTYFALGRRDEALQLRELTLDLRRTQLGPDHPDTLASMNNLANSYDNAGRRQDALKLREECLERTSRTRGPDHTETLRCMNNLGAGYTILGQHERAAKLLQELLALLRLMPEPDYSLLLPAMHNLAENSQALGRPADALNLYEETLALAKDKLPENQTLRTMNNLAWLLATADNVDFRKPARAIELAAKAVQLSPKNADFTGTLGVARYRNGDWKQAVADLESAIKFRNHDAMSANESFFLAMTRWQLGDKAAARTAFEKAVAWMEKGKMRQDELRRFRAEAAELLGIEDEANRPDP